MIRVWFNHWFSTSYGIIELMKKDNEDEIYVIGSNRRQYAIYQKVCDEWYVDSTASGEEYVKFALEFCKEHKIDVFAPRRNMIDIARNKNRFKEIGAKVLLDDYEKMALLNDKAETYKFLKDCPSLNIPDFEIVNNYDSFVSAYKKLHEKYNQVCVKFVQDEGAMSYRCISREEETSDSIRMYPGAEVSFEKYAKALKEMGTFDDLMVMPYLPSYEISVDCLNIPKGLIAIPRFKTSGREEEIKFDPEILSMVKEIIEKLVLSILVMFNLRLRMKSHIYLKLTQECLAGHKCLVWQRESIFQILL